jgi:hypothetical protein
MSFSISFFVSLLLLSNPYAKAQEETLDLTPHSNIELHSVEYLLRSEKGLSFSSLNLVTT